MKFKNILLIVAISAATSVVSLSVYNKWLQKNTITVADTTKLPVHFTGFDGNDAAAPTDFTTAATLAAPAVVHIKTHISERQVSAKEQPDGDDPIAQFFGTPQQRVIPEQKGSGSGVILSEDGYIVTNNHVIENADNITVTLANHKTYKATIIGADPKTDIAVLKIDVSHLPFLVYGNSDDAEIGQWVLAIGFPWNLDITVTAGIVSAKTRTEATDNPQRPLETFIQTDAAVNLGNSGGALVNTRGELIGINTALESPTGAYAGYSYAIPVNTVKKKVNDLIKNSAVRVNKS